MKYLLTILFSVLVVSCSDHVMTSLSDVREGVSTRANVDIANKSQSNPNLLNEWENIETIKLNTIGSNGLDKVVTAPWVTSTSSLLDNSFRKDIKKEDGWVMLFHTFKQIGLDEKQNYMLFYNQFTGYVKVFFYYEGDRDSQGTQWFIKTSDGSCTQLLNLTGYLADANTQKHYNMAIFSNLTGEPTQGISPGWNGFEFEVPYCTDYRDLEFTIGAYDKKITHFDFIGNTELNTVGTITPVGNSGGGLRSTVASVFGTGAKKVVDNCVLEAKQQTTGTSNQYKKVEYGEVLRKAISSIPVGGYVQAISTGLNLIFGKTSNVNYSDVKLTTTGKIQFAGTGTTETTTGIPSITFNLYSMMNSDLPSVDNGAFVYNPSNGKDHFIGVWTLMNKPTIIYSRLTPITNFCKNELCDKTGDMAPGLRRWYFYGKTTLPNKWHTMYVAINPDLNKYLKESKTSNTLMGCDKMGGEIYLPNVVDIDDSFNKDYIYRDSLKSFYQVHDNKTEMLVGGLMKEKDFFYVVTDVARTTFKGRQLYFDWGNIDCGRMVDAISATSIFDYKGKNIRVNQTRVYPIQYAVDEGCVIDGDSYSKNLEIELFDNLYFNSLRKKAGLPIVDYGYE